MKTLSQLVLLSVCVVIHAHAQDEPSTPEAKMFDAAAQLAEKEDYLTAAVEFEQFIKQYPKSELVARAHFNRAICYFLFKDYETAEEIFLEILKKPYNEKDPNSLMEPYALYKHNTCRYLAHIALEQKDYEAAEKYINLFDKKYPYQHFCGNEWSAYDMYKAVMYSKVYRGTNQIEKAMNLLLPYIFSNALASNEEVLTELEDIIEMHFSKDDAAVEFEKALSTLDVKVVKKSPSATIQLYGVKIEVEESFLTFTMEGEEETPKTHDQEYYKQIVLNNILFQRFL